MPEPFPPEYGLSPLMEAYKKSLEEAIMKTMGLPPDILDNVVTDSVAHVKMKMSLQPIGAKYLGYLATILPTYSKQYVYFTIRPRIADWRRAQLRCKIA